MDLYKVFVSSTFGDFQLERDFIKSHLQPLLNKELIKVDAHIEFVDLRWGVNIENQTNSKEKDIESKILQVCFDEIINTQPFFLAFVGERYGWVPEIDKIFQGLSEVPENIIKKILGSLSKNDIHYNKNKKSVTEIEIRLALLGEVIRPDNCIFCFRDKKSYCSLTEEQKRVFIQNDNIKEINSLKKEIEDICRQKGGKVIDYYIPLNLNTHALPLEFNEIGTKLFEFFLNKIKENQKKNNVKRDSLSSQITCFIADKLYNYVDVEKWESKICEVIFSENPISVVISGEEGTGKTSILAKVFQESNNISGTVALFYSSLFMKHGPNIKDILKHLIGQICCIMGLNNPIDNEFSISDIITAFTECISFCTNRGERVIIFLDDIDNLPENLIPLLPEDSLKVVTTRKSKDFLKDYLRNSVEINIMGFNKKNAIQFLENTLSKCSFSLNDYQKELLIDRGSNSLGILSPLWLSLALRTVMTLNRFDFNFGIDIEIEHLKNSSFKKFVGEVQNKHGRLNSTVYSSILILNLPSSLKTLLEFITEKSLTYFGSQEVKRFLILFYLIEDTISDETIFHILQPMSEVEISQLKHWFENLFFNTVNNGNNRFFHNIVKTYFIDEIKDDLYSYCVTIRKIMHKEQLLNLKIRNAYFMEGTEEFLKNSPFFNNELNLFIKVLLEINDIDSFLNLINLLNKDYSVFSKVIYNKLIDLQKADGFFQMNKKSEFYRFYADSISEFLSRLTLGNSFGKMPPIYFEILLDTVRIAIENDNDYLIIKVLESILPILKNYSNWENPENFPEMEDGLCYTSLLQRWLGTLIGCGKKFFTTQYLLEKLDFRQEVTRKLYLFSFFESQWIPSNEAWYYYKYGEILENLNGMNIGVMEYYNKAIEEFSKIKYDIWNMPYIEYWAFSLYKFYEYYCLNGFIEKAINYLEKAIRVLENFIHFSEDLYYQEDRKENSMEFYFLYAIEMDKFINKYGIYNYPAQVKLLKNALNLIQQTYPNIYNNIKFYQFYQYFNKKG